MGLERPVRARADGRAVANHTSDPLGVGNGDALAPENAGRMFLVGSADGLVEEVKRCLANC